MKKDGGPWAWATVGAMFLVYFLERVNPCGDIFFCTPAGI